MTLRLVALGDSTVEGLMDPDPATVDASGGPRYVGWADRFARRLAAEHPGLLYANLGVRGWTAAQVRAGQLDRALALRPDVAVLVAGVNDVLRPRLDEAALREDLLAMFSGLHGAGAEVLSFTMPDMSRVAPLARFLRPRVERLNAVVREAGATYGTKVVDFAAIQVAGHPALWHDDRLHANSEGHRRIAAALAELHGLPPDDGPDWRDEPEEPVVTGALRIAAREVAWVASHLAPWAWGRLRGHEFATGGVCKRPDLLPVEEPAHEPTP